MPTPAQSKLLLALTEKKEAARSEFEKRHAFAKKWLDERGLSLDQIRTHSTRLLAGATLSSALLLSSPQLPLIGKNVPVQVKVLMQDFLKKLTHTKEAIGEESETEITQHIKQLYGVDTAFTLDQQRLPTYFGSMGLEQHLVRFPGDGLTGHRFPETGLAPGRGAFGYFADEGKSPAQAEAEEMFYIVLQTFVIPDWERDWVRLKEWYKFRKFLVINPENGRAVVAVLGDSGPATWTGKVFGGSPEVMDALGYYPKRTRGDVFVIYLDDPAGSVPLGPILLKGDRL